MIEVLYREDLGINKHCWLTGKSLVGTSALAIYISELDTSVFIDSEKLFFLTSRCLILDDERMLWFIHIPKNAGSTIRRVVSDHTTYDLSLEQRKKCARLGVDVKHLTPSDIEKHFPDLFCVLRQYRVIAFLRDPFDRFVSSLAQKTRWYSKKELEYYTYNELKMECENILDVLWMNKFYDIKLSIEYTHFIPQSNFIHADLSYDLYTVDDVVSVLKNLGYPVPDDLRINETLQVNKHSPLRVFLKKNKMCFNWIIGILPKRIQTSLLFWWNSGKQKFEKGPVITHLANSDRFRNIYKEDISLYKK